MTPFNFRDYLKKQASYEGAQGYFSAQSRAWCNCFRDKLRASKKPQEAWQGCLEEYDKAAGNAEWAIKYASQIANGLYKEADVKDDKSYGRLIHKNIEEGLPVKAAIFKAIQSFFGVKPAKTAQATAPYELVEKMTDKVVVAGDLPVILAKLDELAEKEQTLGEWEVWDTEIMNRVVSGNAFFCASELRKLQ